LCFNWTSRYKKLHYVLKKPVGSQQICNKELKSHRPRPVLKTRTVRCIGMLKKKWHCSFPGYLKSKNTNACTSFGSSYLSKIWSHQDLKPFQRRDFKKRLLKRHSLKKFYHNIKYTNWISSVYLNIFVSASVGFLTTLRKGSWLLQVRVYYGKGKGICRVKVNLRAKKRRLSTNLSRKAHYLNFLLDRDATLRLSYVCKKNFFSRLMNGLIEATLGSPSHTTVKRPFRFKTNISTRTRSS